jgi:peptide/nickel transport system ATP-binding protein
MTNPDLLTVAGLGVRFRSGRGTTCAVQDMSYSLSPGETLGLIGASGSGKSASCRAVLGLLPTTAAVTGSVKLLGRELVGEKEPVLRAARRAHLAFVGQDPARSLDPTMRIGSQLAEAARLRERLGPTEARDRATELLGVVGLASHGQRYGAFPHELSGGMRQRVAIALALTGWPRVLIADEPTTALDARTQAQILELLAALGAAREMAMVLVSHDLGVVSDYADRVIVMQHGRIVDTADLSIHPATEYIRRLAAAGPGRQPTSVERQHGAAASRRAAPPPRPVLVEARGIVQEFPAPRRPGARAVPALWGVSGVSLDIREGEILGLIGESGAGKSTLARSLVFGPKPTAGVVRLRGIDLNTLSAVELRQTRRDMQVIFQNPGGSIDPTWKVARIVQEPLRIHAVGTGVERRRRVDEVLKLVGLEPRVYAGRRRHQLSGGEAQRVAIARALSVSPSLLVCDEPVSSLDTDATRELTELLERLSAELRVSCLLIAHDLDLVSQISDRTAVMYRGQLCEVGPTAAVMAAPLHPHSAELRLLSSRTGSVRVATGEAPHTLDSSSPADRRSGCRFRARCPRAAALCAVAEPEMRALDDDRTVACHFPLDRPAATSGMATPSPLWELARHR